MTQAVVEVKSVQHALHSIKQRLPFLKIRSADDFSLPADRSTLPTGETPLHITESDYAYLPTASAEARDASLATRTTLLRRSSHFSTSSASSNSTWRSLSTIHPGWNEPPRPHGSDRAPTSLEELRLEPSPEAPKCTTERTRRCSASSINSNISWGSLSTIDPAWRESSQLPVLLESAATNPTPVSAEREPQEEMEWEAFISPTQMTELRAQRPSEDDTDPSVFEVLFGTTLSGISNCFGVFARNDRVHRYDAL